MDIIKEQEYSPSEILILCAGYSVPTIQGRGVGRNSHKGQQGWNVHTDRTTLLLCFETRERTQFVFVFCLLLLLLLFLVNSTRDGVRPKLNTTQLHHG